MIKARKDKRRDGANHRESPGPAKLADTRVPGTEAAGKSRWGKRNSIHSPPNGRGNAYSAARGLGSHGIRDAILRAGFSTNRKRTAAAASDKSMAIIASKYWTSGVCGSR